MPNNTLNTPRRFRRVWTSRFFWRPHLVTDAGTFNGVAYLTASNTSVLTSRWWFCNYQGDSGTAADKRRVANYSFHVPDDYIAGTDIKIRIYCTSNEINAGGEFIDWRVGFTKPNSGRLGGESTTEYKTLSVALTPTVAEFRSMTSATTSFAGSTLVAGSKVSVIIARDSGADTADDISYIQGIEFFYQRRSNQAESDNRNIKATPINIRPSYREVRVAASETAAQSGTFDGLSTVTASLAVLTNRWDGITYDDGQNKNRTFNWVIPPDYKRGSQIELTVKYFGSTASTNAVWFFAGLTTDTLGTVYGDASDSEHIAPLIGNPIAMNATAFTESSITFRFNGTNKSGQPMTSGDPVAFSVIRQGTAAGDTYTGDFVPIAFIIRYLADEFGELNV